MTNRQYQDRIQDIIAFINEKLKNEPDNTALKEVLELLQQMLEDGLN
ncbi:MAG: hypothetical protein IJ679_08175 [Lachnospiraceae bacterium]|nr:hypothetical protein [Lachnospiraceae bacterium]